jgi:putative transposase
MKKSRFTEQEIVRILKEIEAGAKVVETCRKHGISEATYYQWKTKYAGLEVSQLLHLKEVEGELARMKRMNADLALERHALKDVLSRFSTTQLVKG